MLKKALKLEQLAHLIAFSDWAERLRVAARCAELRGTPGVLEMAAALSDGNAVWLLQEDSLRVLDKLHTAEKALAAARVIFAKEKDSASH